MSVNRPILAWYGDDFTGSAVVAEILDGYGLESVLFTELPGKDLLDRFQGVAAIGIAGSARSQSPDWMDRELPKIFDWLQNLEPEIIQFKVCSTMDSSPEIGSIGRAIEIGARVTGKVLTPVMFASPEFRRYQAFGHLFASDRSGVVRIDRHDTMSRHPSTPIGDSDTRRHLSAQTELGLGLVSLEDIRSPDGPGAAFRRELDAGRPVVSVDVIDAETEKHIAAAIWDLRPKIGIAFGSQGLSNGLAAHWRDLGLCSARKVKDLGPAERPVVVVSGSQSPQSAAQIAHAEAAGFGTVAVNSPDIAAGRAKAAEDAAVLAALVQIEAGRDVILHAANGPSDARISAFREAATETGLSLSEARIALARVMGRILARLVDAQKLTRVGIAGGDTSSHATTALGIAALTPRFPLAGGAALHTGHFADPDREPIHIMLKGGQMGPTDLYERLRLGSLATSEKGELTATLT